MKSALLLFGFCLIWSTSGLNNITQIILAHGYPAEEHVAQTSDGFQLRIQRIPYGKNGFSKANVKRPVVFLQHGLLDSAATWVINPAKEGLGYILADAGFDVFLGNARGNTWSSVNTKYSNTDDAYWELIDFDNMIQIDLAAQIEKALQVSGQSTLVYIGHSQGSIMGFGGFSMFPDLAAKVNLFIALAPVAYVNHQTSYFLTILADLDATVILELLGDQDFLPNDALVRYFGGELCVIAPWACADVIFLICGYDTTNLNNTRLPTYIDYTPAGTSVRNMAHWVQMTKNGKFQMYDYGLIGNLQHYNNIYPPSYALQNLTSPKVALFTGGKDDLADPADVQRLIAELPSSNKPIFTNNQPTYMHLDFTWGENAYQLIYPQIVQLALKYSSK